MSSADNISAYCRAVQIFHILSLHVYYILYATRILMFVVQTKFGNISVSGLCDGSAAVSVTARKCDAVTRDAARVITNVSMATSCVTICHQPGAGTSQHWASLATDKIFIAKFSCVSLFMFMVRCLPPPRYITPDVLIRLTI